MVARGYAWLQGGVRGCWGGACVVAGGGMCQGVHGCGGHAWLWGRGVRGIRRDTVNEQAVRILLECILVRVDKKL